MVPLWITQKKFRFFFAATLLLACIIGFAWSMSDNGQGRRFERTNVQVALHPPSWTIVENEQKTFTIFGTDQLGRDLFARCIVGGAISIAVGIAAACIAVVLGFAAGESIQQ